MFIHWDDLDRIHEGLDVSDACRLDPATGRFSDDADGLPLLESVAPRPDERAAWGAGTLDPAPATVVRARWLMVELRERRAAAAGLADPALAARLTRVLDAPGSPEQRAALAAQLAARRSSPGHAALVALVERDERERADREDALLWREETARDDDSLAALRIAAFDRQLREAAPGAHRALMDGRWLARLSAIRAWAARLPDPPDNEPPWIAEVLAWRAAQAEAQRRRIAGLLARIDGWLATHAPAVHAELRPGADAARLDACARALGGPLPPGLRELWAWHDGGGELAPVAYVYALHGCEEMLAERGRLRAAFADTPGWWDPAWLPVLHDPSGNAIVVDPAGGLGGAPGQVIGFWHDSTDRHLLAHDVESWLEILAALYASGAITADEYGLVGVSEWDWCVWARRLTGGRPLTFTARG